MIQKKLCGCGCGKTVRRERNRFIHGHNSRVWTDEIKRKIGDAAKIFMIGNKNSLGHKISEENRKKLIGNKHSVGKKRSESFKEIMRKLRKGKTYEEIFGKEKAEQIKEKLRHPTDEARRKMGEFNRNLSEEKREDLRKRMIGNKYAISENWSDEAKEKLRERRKLQIFPLKDTSIEKIIQNFLTLLHKEYFTHKYIDILHGYQCDIFIPIQDGILQKTIIECDGDFFHCNPKFYKAGDRNFKNSKTAKEIWEIDKIRTKELEQKGFRVIRLWGNEINKMNLESFKCRLQH